MPAQTDSSLNGRERAAVRRAHEMGYLDARRRNNGGILKAHGLWCWRLKLPMVWFERRSPWSRYGRIRLDMMTCGNILTQAALNELQALLEAECVRRGSAISSHEARLDYIPATKLDEVARKLFRVANKPANRAPARSRLVAMPASQPQTRLRRNWKAVSA